MDDIFAQTDTASMGTDGLAEFSRHEHDSEKLKISLVLADYVVVIRRVILNGDERGDSLPR